MKVLFANTTHHTRDTNTQCVLRAIASRHRWIPATGAGAAAVVLVPETRATIKADKLS